VLLADTTRQSRRTAFDQRASATIEPMAALHESTDFTGNSDLPKGWEDDVFRYCTLSNIDVEGKAFEGILSDCTVSDSSWYWGLFNTTKFVGVEFRNCLFRGSSFAGCVFAKCRFESCRFMKDNLNSDCTFSECSWYDCEQADCEGLSHQFACETKHRKT
jgi:uncharacterized protein YjbI with pentapeptide repeats